jgi:hypothetical protein
MCHCRPAAQPHCRFFIIHRTTAIRASQWLTIDRAPSLGLTAYTDAGVIAAELVEWSPKLR